MQSPIQLYIWKCIKFPFESEENVKIEAFQLPLFLFTAETN